LETFRGRGGRRSTPLGTHLLRHTIQRPQVLGLLACLVFAGRAAAASATGDLKAQVVNEQKQPIAGAMCDLTGPSLSTRGLHVTSGQKGGIDFPGLLWGKYTLTCAAAGYRALSREDIALSPQQPVAQIEMVLPAQTVFRQNVEVKASPEAIPAQQTGAPASKLAAQQLMTLPLTEMSFRAAIPLVPGVVRLPNGKLNIKGEQETQGLLLVDSTEMVDPVTGSFSVEVPIDAIESLEVYKSPYLAQYGGFSGGLTVIDTKPPTEQWHWELNDMLPDPFIEEGHIEGIQDYTPRLYFSGPLIQNKLSISESFLYDLHKIFIEGLPWPRNLRKREGFSSFTSLQYVFSARHLLSANARVFPTREEYANIDALIPRPASENYGQKGFAAGATDRYVLGSGGVLSSTFEFTRFNTNAYGQGLQNMLVTPNGFGGNYFNAYQRYSNQEEAAETYQLPSHTWRGTHQVEVGADYFRRAYSGASDSHPVLVTDAGGNVLESIEFNSPAPMGDKDTEVAGFAQDHWTFSNHLSVDAGLRYANETFGSHTAFAPRLGFAYSPFSSGHTLLRGGAGIFYDREPLLAADFTQNPARTIAFFSPQGALLGPPVLYPNQYGIKSTVAGPFVATAQHPDTTPYDQTWSFETDQELHRGWVLSLSYLASHGQDQFVVNPPGLPGGGSAFLLSNTGTSHYQEFVSTLRVRPGEKADMNFSYVHSHSRGDLNSLGEIYVPDEQPVIRPDSYGNLPSDIPDRLITWCQFHLPGAMELSPVFDVHTGYPFSQIDVLQNYVGVPNSSRFPYFYSFDVKWLKEFRMSPLPWAFIRKHVFRAGFAVFDITNHLNPLDVYNNNASPNFGHLVGFQHRTFATYFDLVK
jgi:hypothetical protein